MAFLICQTDTPTEASGKRHPKPTIEVIGSDSSIPWRFRLIEQLNNSSAVSGRMRCCEQFNWLACSKAIHRGSCVDLVPAGDG